MSIGISFLIGMVTGAVVMALEERKSLKDADRVIKEAEAEMKELRRDVEELQEAVIYGDDLKLNIDLVPNSDVIFPQVVIPEPIDVKAPSSFVADEWYHEEFGR